MNTKAKHHALEALRSGLNAEAGEPCDGCGKTMSQGEAVFEIPDTQIGIRFVCEACATKHLEATHGDR